MPYEMEGSLLIGKHIIIECEGRHAHLDESELERILSRAAKAAGAHILSSHFHRFGPQMGVTGVLVLAESHITVHTWPEYNYAAFDVFICGACEAEKAVDVIVNALPADNVKIQTIVRGPSAMADEPHDLANNNNPMLYESHY